MISNKKTIESISGQIHGKRVLIRADYNVPLSGDRVSDERRIAATVPTINFAFEHGAKCVIIMSHLGRPDGRVQLKYSMAPVVEPLSKLLRRPVTLLDDCVGEKVESACLNAENGSVILLENLRFHVEEEGKGVAEDGSKTKANEEDIKKFRASLTKIADIYINDAFGTAHRAHSSMVGVNCEIMAAGLLLQKELQYFGKALESPEKPFLAILGGAKIADKIQLITNLLDRVNMMIIGGGMVFTFQKVLKDMKIGKSLYDEAGAAIVSQIMQKAKEKNVEIILAEDFICGSDFKNDCDIKTCTIEQGVPEGYMGLDIGPESIKKCSAAIMRAKTILFNGPPGVFELENFSKGSTAFLNAVIDATSAGATSIVGGGDTASLVEKHNQSAAISHVSTGGGASLELLEGKDLPGVAAIPSK